MTRLIVVSNRVSAPVDPAAGSAGGLAMALSAALRKYDGLWFGWSGETIETFTGELRVEDRAGVTVNLVDLEAQDVEEYYNGYANKTLWPLFHYVQDVLDTNPLNEQWEAYKRANEAFCDEILPRCSPGDTVWVHDYHLMLLPTMLKSRMPSLRVGWFLHTPFPTSEVFRMIPMREALMQGVAGAEAAEGSSARRT